MKLIVRKRVLGLKIGLVEIELPDIKVEVVVKASVDSQTESEPS